MPNESEFVRVIKEHEGLILRVARVYTDDREERRDLYQEIVFQLWKSFDSFRSESKVSTWMYRIALNTSISHLHRRKKKWNHVSMDVSFDIVEDTDASADQMETMYRHIRALGDIEKAIVLLYLEGKTYDEIAAVTGFTPTNVGVKLNRIKQKMKDQVKQ